MYIYICIYTFVTEYLPGTHMTHIFQCSFHLQKRIILLGSDGSLTDDYSMQFPICQFEIGAVEERKYQHLEKKISNLQRKAP